MKRAIAISLLAGWTLLFGVYWSEAAGYRPEGSDEDEQVVAQLYALPLQELARQTQPALPAASSSPIGVSLIMLTHALLPHRLGGMPRLAFHHGPLHGPPLFQRFSVYRL